MREISIHCAFILFLYLQSEKKRYSLCLADVVLVFFNAVSFIFYFIFQKNDKIKFSLIYVSFPCTTNCIFHEGSRIRIGVKGYVLHKKM